MSGLSHAGVRRAFRLVGDQLEAERLARIAARDAAPAPELPAWQAREVARVRPCQMPGCHSPGRLFARGRLCTEHLPPQPTGGYCAPGRCYCPSKPCRRPA